MHWTSCNRHIFLIVFLEERNDQVPKVIGNQASAKVVVVKATIDFGLLVVDKKKLHSNAIWKQNQTITKKVKLEQTHVALGQYVLKLLIEVNMDGKPMVPSWN